MPYIEFTKYAYEPAKKVQGPAHDLSFQLLQLPLEFKKR
jgi:hypothetical protein